MIGIFKGALFKRILNVGFFQAVSQVVNALTGFLIIRSLGKEEYGAYALFFSVLSVIALVSGIGIQMGMSVIGGRVWQDRQAVGSLVRTLESLRMMLFRWMLAPFAAYTIWLFYKNGIGLGFALFALAVVLAIVWLQIHANLKFEVAKLLNRTDIINRYELVPSVVRLGVVAVLLLVLPGAVFPILLVTLLSYLIQYRMIQRQVAGLYEPATAVDPEYRKEVFSLIKSDALNILYFVFQGQVVIVLLSIFLNVTSISNVTALGRIMVVFAILNMTLTTVLIPVFAKEHDLKRLRDKFFQSSAVYIALLVAMCLMAYFFPDLLLWALGEKYANLREELFVMVVGSCFFQYVSFMYWFIASKGWVKYHWLYTPFTIINQAVLIFTLDLRTEMGIIWFGALSHFGFFLINCISLTLGFSNKVVKPGYEGAAISKSIQS